MGTVLGPSGERVVEGVVGRIVEGGVVELSVVGLLPAAAPALAGLFRSVEDKIHIANAVRPTQKTDAETINVRRLGVVMVTAAPIGNEMPIAPLRAK